MSLTLLAQSFAEKLTAPVDPVTSALTGHLSFYLILAGVLTWPVSLILLGLYTRAVRRSMRKVSHSGEAPRVPAPPAAGGPSAEAPPKAAPHAAALRALPDDSRSSKADALLQALCMRPWRAAIVYATGGAAYAVVMTSAFLLADGLEFLPLRFFYLFWTFAWPIVPTMAIVGPTTRRTIATMAGAYLLVLTIIGAVEISRSPDLTWIQVFTPWVLYDIPPTILMAAYITRRIRAVGPLVLIFLLLSFIGSDVVVTIAGSRNSYLLAILGVTQLLGLGAAGTLVSLLVVGFLLFAVIGWTALVLIRRRYQAKMMSDESVAVDAVWMLFTAVHSMDLVFENPWWALTGVVMFAAYKLGTGVGFRIMGRAERTDTNPPKLLVLRSFSIGKASERFFDVLGRHWRRVGSMQMIAGVDLASRTIEPHEFLDFISGKLSRRFIDGRESLDQRMAERDTKHDRDLRFRVNEFFCYDDTWRMVLDRLVDESEAVVMDLRGFTRQNTGCMFELHELARLVPLSRVVFITDERTDEALLAESLDGTDAGVFRLRSLDSGLVHQLMHALANAAASSAA